MSEMVNLQVGAKEIVLDWMGSAAFIPSNKKLLRIIGDTNTILLAEAINQYRRWEQKGALKEDGSFYWTQLDCELETGYSRSTQQRAFKDMEKRGLAKAESHTVVINGEEKSVRFITLYFNKVAELMFSDDTAIIETIKKKYEKLKKQNNESRKKDKEEKAMIQNESSLETVGVIQNESSGGGFKMNHHDDSKWVPSNKDLFIKNDLKEEEEEEEASPLLDHPSFKLLKDIAMDQFKFPEDVVISIISLLNANKVTSIPESVLIDSFDKVQDEINRNYIKGDIVSWTAVKIQKELIKAQMKKDEPNKPKQQKKSYKKSSRTEILPDWFDKGDFDKEVDGKSLDELKALREVYSGEAKVWLEEKIKNIQEGELKKQEIDDMLMKLRA